MPTVKTSKRVANQQKTPARSSGESVKMVLPSKPHKPVDDWHKYGYLITGPKKIGKTQTSVQLQPSLIIQCDRPQRSLEIMEVYPKTWRQYLSIQSQLLEQCPYEMVVIDGADQWYRLCYRHICKELGISDPADLPFGKAWSAIKVEFSAAVDALNSIDAGRIFICHATMREVTGIDGVKHDALVPVLSGQAEETINGKVDMWTSMQYRGRRRVFVIEGRQGLEVGHSIKGHFLATDGTSLREIPMGASPKEAMDNFIKGFNNQLPPADVGKRSGRTRRTGSNGAKA